MPVRVVKGDVHRVNRRTYVVLRSFIDSSLRSDMPWNIGVSIDGNVVEFRKPGRWALVISKNMIMLLDANNYPILRVEINGGSVRLKVENFEWSVELSRLADLLNIYVYNDELEYATPLNLYTIIHKIFYYYRSSMGS
jgi:hypothetical protein